MAATEKGTKKEKSIAEPNAQVVAGADTSNQPNDSSHNPELHSENWLGKGMLKMYDPERGVDFGSMLSGVGERLTQKLQSTPVDNIPDKVNFISTDINDSTKMRCTASTFGNEKNSTTTALCTIEKRTSDDIQPPQPLISTDVARIDSSLSSHITEIVPDNMKLIVAVGTAYAQYATAILAASAKEPGILPAHTARVPTTGIVLDHITEKVANTAEVQFLQEASLGIAQGVGLTLVAAKDIVLHPLDTLVFPTADLLLDATLIAAAHHTIPVYSPDFPEMEMARRAVTTNPNLYYFAVDRMNHRLNSLQAAGYRFGAAPWPEQVRMVSKVLSSMATSGYATGALINSAKALRNIYEIGVPLRPSSFHNCMGEKPSAFPPGWAEIYRTNHNPKHIKETPGEMFYNFVITEDNKLILNRLGEAFMDRPIKHVDLAGGRPLLSAGMAGFENGTVKFITIFCDEYLAHGPFLGRFTEQVFIKHGFDAANKFIRSPLASSYSTNPAAIKVSNSNMSLLPPAGAVLGLAGLAGHLTAQNEKERQQRRRLDEAGGVLGLIEQGLRGQPPRWQQISYGISFFEPQESEETDFIPRLGFYMGHFKDDKGQIVYRGDCHGPSEIFKEGFKKEVTVTNVLEHIQAPEGGYIATSRSKEVAQGYPADSKIPSGVTQTYIYEIYPTKPGIDVAEALAKCGGDKYVGIFEKLQEVAFPENIQPREIKGCWEVGLNKVEVDLEIYRRLGLSGELLEELSCQYERTVNNKFIPNPKYKPQGIFAWNSARLAGVGLFVYGATLDSFNFYGEYQHSQLTGDYRNTYREINRIAGGWTGAYTMGSLLALQAAAYTALLTPPVQAICTATAGLVGSGLGYWGGSEAGVKLYDLNIGPKMASAVSDVSYSAIDRCIKVGEKLLITLGLREEARPESTLSQKTTELPQPATAPISLPAGTTKMTQPAQISRSPSTAANPPETTEARSSSSAAILMDKKIQNIISTHCPPQNGKETQRRKFLEKNGGVTGLIEGAIKEQLARQGKLRGFDKWTAYDLLPYGSRAREFHDRAREMMSRPNPRNEREREQRKRRDDAGGVLGLLEKGLREHYAEQKAKEKQAEAAEKKLTSMRTLNQAMNATPAVYNSSPFTAPKPIHTVYRQPQYYNYNGYESPFVTAERLFGPMRAYQDARAELCRYNLSPTDRMYAEACLHRYLNCNMSQGYSYLGGLSSFSAGLAATGLITSYNNYNIGSLVRDILGSMGQIGGVATKIALIENLPNGEAHAKAEEYFFCFPQKNVPFPTAFLEKIKAEVFEGYFRYKTLPFFSLHFNNDGFMYPVIHPFYQHTLTGVVIAYLDDWMKGFLNGGFFDEDFVKKWALSPHCNEAELRLHLKDFKKYAEKIYRYESLREKESRAEVLTLGRGDTKDGMMTSFRIIAKQGPGLRCSGNIIIADPTFDVEFSVELNPDFKAYLERYHKEHGSYPKAYEKTLEGYHQFAEEIKQKMPLLFPEYFQLLGIINTFCYAAATFEKMGLAPVISPEALAVDKERFAVPKAFPPLPIRYFRTYPLEITLKTVLEPCLPEAVAAFNAQFFQLFSTSSASSSWPETINEQFKSILRNLIQIAISPKINEAFECNEDELERIVTTLDERLQGIVTQIRAIYPKILYDLLKPCGRQAQESLKPLSLPEKIKATQKALEAHKASVLKKWGQEYDLELLTPESTIEANTLYLHFDPNDFSVLKYKVQDPQGKVIEDTIQTKEIENFNPELIMPETLKAPILTITTERGHTQWINDLTEAEILQEFPVSWQASVREQLKEGAANVNERMEKTLLACKYAFGLCSVQEKALLDSASTPNAELASFQSLVQNLEKNSEEAAAQELQMLTEALANINQGIATLRQNAHRLTPEGHARLKELEELSAQCQEAINALPEEKVKKLAEIKAVTYRHIVENIERTVLEKHKTMRKTRASFCLEDVCRQNLERLQSYTKNIEQFVDFLRNHPQLASRLISKDYTHSFLTFTGKDLNEKIGESYKIVGGCGMRLPNLHARPIEHLQDFSLALADAILENQEGTASFSFNHRNYTAVTLPVTALDNFAKPTLFSEEGKEEVLEPGATAAQQLVDVVCWEGEAILGTLDPEILKRPLDPAKACFIHYAATLFKGEQIRKLAAKSAQNLFRLSDLLGNTPLHFAVQEGNTDVIAVILEEDPALVDLPNHEGLTPLICAVQKNHLDVVELLIRFKANPNYRLPNGLFPLYMALQIKASAIALWLLDHVADLNVSESLDSKMTPLHLAIEMELLEVATKLVEKGASCTVKRKSDGFTPLDCAIKKGYVELIKRMQNVGVSLNTVSEYKKNGLHHAAEAGQVACLAFLVEQGLDCGALTEDGESPLMLAIKSGQREAALFLAQKAPIDQKNRKQETASLTALHYGMPAVSDILIERKESPNSLDNQGYNYVYYLVRHGDSRRFINLLTHHRIDCKQLFQGKNLLELAAQWGQFFIVYELLKAKSLTMPKLPLLHCAVASDEIGYLCEHLGNITLVSFDPEQSLTEEQKKAAQMRQIPIIVKKNKQSLWKTSTQYSVYGSVSNAKGSLEWKETLLESLPEDEIEVLESLDFASGSIKSTELSGLLVGIIARGHDPARAYLDSTAHAKLTVTAAKKGSVRSLAWLLKIKLPADYQDLLKVALEESHSAETIKILIKHCDVHAALDNEGNTALHLATKVGFIAGLNVLLNAGSLVTLRNKYNQTPLHLALIQKDTKVLKCLFKRSKPAEWPLDLWQTAVEEPSPELLNILLRYRNRLSREIKIDLSKSLEKSHDLPNLLLNQEQLEGLLVLPILFGQTNYDEAVELLSEKPALLELFRCAQGSFLMQALFFSFKDPEAVLASLQTAKAEEAEELDQASPDRLLALLTKHGITAQFYRGEHNVLRALLQENTPEEDVVYRLKLLKRYFPESIEPLAMDKGQGSHRFIELALHLNKITLFRELAESCIQIGPSQPTNSFYALHEAVKANHYDLVKALLKLYPVDGLNETRQTPLMLAAYKNNTSMMDLLLMHGALPDKIDLFGRNALYYALSNEAEAAALHLLPLLREMNQADRDGETPLMLAAAIGCLAVVAYFCEQGDYTESYDKRGKNALHHAAIKGQTACIELLVKHNFVVDGVEHPGSSKKRIRCLKRSPLHLAALQGQVKAVRKLIALGADLTLEDSTNQSFFEYALLSKSSEMLELVSEYPQYSMRTAQALLAAATVDNEAALCELIVKGASASSSVRDASGSTLLHLAARYDSSKAMDLLLKREDLNLNLTDTENKTALHYAAMLGHIRPLSALCKAGAEINYSLNQTPTALFLAAEAGHIASVEVLLKYRADYTKTNSLGLTPAQIALVKGHRDIAQRLRAAGDMSLTPTALAKLPQAIQDTLYREQSDFLRTMPVTTPPLVTKGALIRFGIYRVPSKLPQDKVVLNQATLSLPHP